MSYLLKRKDVLLTVVAFCFGLVVVPYFFNLPSLSTAADKLIMIVSIINACSFLLALYAQTRRSLLFVKQRVHGWPYQAYLVVTIYLMIFLGLAFGQASKPFLWFQYAILMPCGSVIYSILAFYMASAGARAFRARSPQALLLLIVGILVLLGQAPLTGAYLPGINSVRQYFTSTFAKGAGRMFTISVTVGAIVLGVRVLLGREAAMLGFVEAGEG